MPDFREFAHIKAVHRPGHRVPILYGASDPTGPWYRLSKRETAFILEHADTILERKPHPEPPNGAVQ